MSRGVRGVGPRAKSKVKVKMRLLEAQLFLHKHISVKSLGYMEGYGYESLAR